MFADHDVKPGPIACRPGTRNEDPGPFAWARSAGEILQTIAEYGQRITEES